MSITGALKAAGYKEEKSTVGDKIILTGIYKCLFMDWKDEPEGKFGPQLMAKFKIVEKLSGSDSFATFPEFTGYYATDVQNINSPKKGLKKLLDGFFSVGKSIDQSTEEALVESLNGLKGSAEVFIKASVKEPVKNIGTKENPEWVANPDGEDAQKFDFVTEKNALKLAEKQIKKDGHPL